MGNRLIGKISCNEYGDTPKGVRACAPEESGFVQRSVLNAGEASSPEETAARHIDNAQSVAALQRFRVKKNTYASLITGWRAYRSGPEWGGGEQYAHCYIEIISKIGFREDSLATYKFQCDGNATYWYGQRIEISFGHLERTAQLMRAIKVLEKIGDFDGPKALIERLMDLNVPRVVYDGRLSEFVPTKNVKPAPWACWVASLHGDSLGVGGVFAESEDDAKLQLIERITKYKGLATVADFVKAGCPCRVSYKGDEVPDILPMAEIFKLIKEPEVAA